jgi:hypothetical protein
MDKLKLINLVIWLHFVFFASRLLVCKVPFQQAVSGTFIQISAQCMLNFPH